MSDVLTPEQRAYCMSRIGPKDSKPEKIVRQMVHKMGFRFRLHQKNLPGTPDIVLARHKKIIMVHGCFWHMHDCKYGLVEPKTNAEFWRNKRLRTVERDLKIKQTLENQGWKVLEIWECQTKQSKREFLLKLLIAFLSKTDN